MTRRTLIYQWFCWQLGIGWRCYMSYLNEGLSTQYWRHERTGEVRTVTRWRPLVRWVK